jgi:PAS domain S-box-containing protein
MKKLQDPSAAAAELRRRAEKRLPARERTPPSAIRNPRSAPDTQRLVHELRVHQIELEMQNEELRHAQRELKVAREKYFDLYEFAPVGYLTLNEPGLILEANLTAARLLGVARTDLLQQPLTRFILRDDLGIFYQHRQQLFETRAPQYCELRLTRPGGAPFWVLGEAILVQDHKTGAPVCRMTLSDLTERKQAEADRERLAQFERLAQLMKCANDIVLLTDGDGRILEANDRTLETYGYSLAELRQKTIEDLRTPESRAVLPHQIEQLETDGRAVFEATHQRRDGFAFPVEISARFFQIAGVPCRLGIVRDITRRKRAEEASRMSEARYRSLFDNMAEGFAYCRMLFEDGRPQDFIYVEVNEAFQIMTGLKNVTGRKVSEVIPGLRETNPELLERYGRVALTGQPERFETYVAALKMWFSISVYCPKKEHFVAVFDVITERKQAEKKMQMFSQEIIAAREEERKRVSSVLHHDVGSLTVGISAHFDAIEQDLRSGKPGEALKWMKRARKLFDESVVRLKKLAIELRPPELDVLGLHAALRQYFSQVTERGGTRVHFRETLGRRRVSGDTATILFRVAQEALTNAIRHGHATRVDVDLRASKEEVTLRVRDNGKGFDPSELTAQVTSQMGLRVMRELALSAGGVFTVDSGRGKGTTVRVRLPIADRGSRIAD